MIKLQLVTTILMVSGVQSTDLEIIDSANYGPCGLTSFFLVCRLRDVPVDWKTANALLGPPSQEGTHSFEEIARAAEQVGLYPIGVTTDAGHLGDLPMPAIVQVLDPRRANTPAHLVVLAAANSANVIIVDPPGPPFSLPVERFAEVWTRNILLFVRTEKERDEISHGAWRTTIWRFAMIGAAGTGFAAFAALMIRVHGWTLLRRVFVAIGVLFALAGAIYGITWLLIFVSTPECVFPDPDIELGELPPGSRTIHVPIRNEGTGPLFFRAIRSSCTCASVKFPDRINGHGTGMIEVELSVSRGPQTARLTIQSNAPGPDRLVHVHWHGRYEPVLHPVHIVSRFAAVERPFERTLRVIYPSGPKALPPVLMRVECESPFVSVQQGSDHPVAPDSGNTPGLSFRELDLKLAVKPPAPGARIETECFVSIRQGENTYRLGFLLSLRFLAGIVTPESAGILFTAPSPADLVGQDRLLRVTVTDNSRELEITDLPAWLACDQTVAGHDARVLRFRVTRPPESLFVSHVLQLGVQGESGKQVPLAIHCVTTR
jgi:hypothetical protein